MKTAVDYFTATMPETWQILGLRLRPFSLEHYKLLRRLDCAYVSPDTRRATRGDLLLGVMACSMLPSEFMAMIDEPLSVGLLGRIWLKIRSKFAKTFIPTCEAEWQVYKWGRHVGLFDMQEASDQFKDYIDQQSVVPKYWEERQGTSSGAHWAQCVEVALRSKLGWTARDLETQPLSKAFYDYFKYAESEGAIRLMTDADIAAIEASKEVAGGS